MCIFVFKISVEYYSKPFVDPTNCNIKSESIDFLTPSMIVVDDPKSSLQKLSQDECIFIIIL